MMLLDKLKKSLHDKGFEPDAVSMSVDIFRKIRNEYEQKFEVNTSNMMDLESFLITKILLHGEDNATKDFEFFVKFKT